MTPQRVSESDDVELPDPPLVTSQTNTSVTDRVVHYSRECRHIQTARPPGVRQATEHQQSEYRDCTRCGDGEETATCERRQCPKCETDVFYLGQHLRDCNVEGEES